MKISTDGKNITVSQESGSAFMKISQYKSKVMLSLKHISDSPLRLPKCAEYKSGWVTFTIDNLNLNSVCDVIIHNFMNTFYC
jgi:hypothetical protein